VRDILETGFLVDYLVTYPHKIAEWKAADKKARITHFGPGVVRTALDKRDGYTSGARKAVYDLISEAASHASYRSFALVANADKLGEIGPFFDEKKLGSWLEELAKRFPHAALHVNSGPGGTDLKLFAARIPITRCDLDISCNTCAACWLEKYRMAHSVSMQGIDQAGGG
jgi:hypothetical protein